jgi:hypothetical protein
MMIDGDDVANELQAALDMAGPEWAYAALIERAIEALRDQAQWIGLLEHAGAGWTAEK